MLLGCPIKRFKIVRKNTLTGTSPFWYLCMGCAHAQVPRVGLVNSALGRNGKRMALIVAQ